MPPLARTKEPLLAEASDYVVRLGYRTKPMSVKPLKTITNPQRNDSECK